MSDKRDNGKNVTQITHYTLNTGHSKESKPIEVNKDMYFTLKRMARSSQQGKKTEVLNNVKMELTKEEGSYIITLSKELNGEDVPFLMTMGCRDKEKSAEMLKNAASVYKTVYHEEVKIFPIAPFCLDIIFPTAVYFTEEMSWTGDFCRCMAWMLLAPEMIR